MKVDLSSKLAQVIEQIPKDVLYDFCCSYAQEHEELAMALVNEFWRPEKDDYRSMVQQCLMHPSPVGIKNGDGYDWGAIAVDLSQIMALADEKVKEGSLLDAAERVSQNSFLQNVRLSLTREGVRYKIHPDIVEIKVNTYDYYR